MVSVQGSLYLGGLSPGWSLSRGVSVQGIYVGGGDLCSGGLCPGILCPGESLSKGGSLSRGVSVMATPAPSMVEEWAVRILLECILVLKWFQCEGSLTS